MKVTADGNPAVYLDRVEVKHSPAEDKWTPEHWTAWPIWAGVDRPEGAGIACSKPQLAERLKKAMLAGVVFENITVGTDVNGKTYVKYSHRVLARILNADLKRLGF